jgi:choice-of-anchor A domain-containing protein
MPVGPNETDMKLYRIASHSIPALLAVAQPALAAKELGDPEAGLQALRELSVTVFGDTKGWLSVEGRSFVGGNLAGGEFGHGNSKAGSADSKRATLTVGGDVLAYTRLNNGPNGADGLVGQPASLRVGGQVAQLDLNSKAASVQVAGHLANTNGSPGSLVEAGGKGLGYLNANGGKIVTGLGDPFASDLAADIASEGKILQADLLALSKTLADMKMTEGNQILNSYGAITFVAVDDGTGKSVFSLSDADFAGWQWSLKAASPSLSIIFNISGSGSYGWNTGLAGDFAAMAPQLIWNFSDAKTLKINQTVFGSVLAGLADVAAQSAIHGSVVANSLQANSGVRLGTYAGGDLDLGMGGGGLSGVPEPASWAMMLAGFGLVGSALRRRQRQLRVLA